MLQCVQLPTYIIQHHLQYHKFKELTPARSSRPSCGGPGSSPWWRRRSSCHPPDTHLNENRSIKTNHSLKYKTSSPIFLSHLILFTFPQLSLKLQELKKKYNTSSNISINKHPSKHILTIFIEISFHTPSNYLIFNKTYTSVPTPPPSPAGTSSFGRRLSNSFSKSATLCRRLYARPRSSTHSTFTNKIISLNALLKIINNIIINLYICYYSSFKEIWFFIFIFHFTGMFSL